MLSRATGGSGAGGPAAAVVGPVGEPHLADQLRLDPVVSLPHRNRSALEWRRRPLQRLELLPKALEAGVVEAGADLGDVDEPALVVEADVQRAEVAARALRIRVATHHELLPALALDLDPLARAAARVRARRAFGHDAFEALLRRGLQEGRAVLGHVIHVAHGTEGRHEHAQAR